MSEKNKIEPGMLGWPNAYPNPPYIDHPSPAAAEKLGDNYAHAPEFLLNYFACSRCNTINMSGSRSTDRKRLKALTGDPPQGKLSDYDCHHIYDFNFSQDAPQCTAQFILRRSHIDSYQHAGAVNQYETFFEKEYKDGLPDIFKADLASPDVLRAPAVPSLLKDVESFEQNYRLLPSWLRELYLKGLAAAPAYRFENGRLEYIYVLAPLFAADERDCGIDTVFQLGIFSGTEILRDKFSHAVPFAFDPCGNIFFANGDKDVYFFDHETASCERVTAVETDTSIPPEPVDEPTYNEENWSTNDKGC